MGECIESENVESPTEGSDDRDAITKSQPHQPKKVIGWRARCRPVGPGVVGDMKDPVKLR